MDNKNLKKDTLGKAILKTVIMLILLSTIGFVVSYVLIFAFERLFQVNNSYTDFSLVYKDGTDVKAYSSASMKIIIQTMVYMITVFVLFLVSLNVYFKRHVLSKKDSIIYSIFMILLLYVSSFLLINMGIRNVNDIIDNFNKIILTYNANSFEKYINKLANLKILVTVIYSLGATLTCLFSLIVIKNSLNEAESKPEGEVRKVVVKKIVKPVSAVSEKKEEPEKPEEPEKQPVVGKKEEPVAEASTKEEKVAEVPKEEVVEKTKEEAVTQEVKQEVKQEEKKETTSVDVAAELDEEEKRIVSEINNMISDLDASKKEPEKTEKVEKKVSFVGQNTKKKNNNNKKK